MVRHLLLILLCLSFAGCGSRSSAPAEPAPPPARITQFYASPNAVGKGEKALLCYGVEAASSVALDPPVDRVWPALSRCLDVSPGEDTEYRLIATGRDGKPVSAVTKITVGAPKPPAPKFVDLQINSTKVRRGETISFCFKATNGAAVVGSPGRFQRNGNPAADCLIHQPTQTTSYRLDLTGPGGADSASITVTVL